MDKKKSNPEAASESRPAEEGPTITTGAERRDYQLSGLHCAACAAAVQKALRKFPLEDLQVNPLTQKMSFYLDPSLDKKPDDEEILGAVRAAGYDGERIGQERAADRAAGTKPSAAPAAGRRMDQLLEEEYGDCKRRFCFSLIFMIPLMYCAMGAMIGLPQIPGLSAEEPLANALLQLLLTLPVLRINEALFVRGFKGLLHAMPNMDSLIAVGSGSSVLYGVVTLFRMHAALAGGRSDALQHLSHELYFESAVMILVLIALGKMLEARAKKRTGEGIRLLMELAPRQAWVEMGDGRIVARPVEALRPGDVLVLRPGEKVAVDGTVLEGHSSVDSSALSGESIPLEVSAGDSLRSGMINQKGSLRYRAERTGEDSSLARMIRLVEEAASSRAPISRLADRVAAIFVPVVMGIALLTLIVHWLIGGSFGQALSPAITVLVISCPCALGLATPVAIMAASGKGASLGVLFHNAEAMERCAHVTTLVFDKTGTLTKGKAEVRDVVCTPPDEPAEMLRLLAALEAASEHPLAAAVTRAADSAGLVYRPAKELRTLTGRGIEGEYEGMRLAAGNRAFYLSKLDEDSSDYHCAGPAAILGRADAYEQAGKTCLYFMIDGHLRAIVTVQDALKPAAAQLMSELRRRGLKTVMLSGDSPTVAEPMARSVGMDTCRAGLLPEDKLRILQDLQEHGERVLMIGDGINDAPALARADVGLAMGDGSDIAMENADIVLMRTGLSSILNVLDLSRMCMRLIRQNLFWAFFYNVLLIPVAAGLFNGYGVKVSPMMGAVAMSLSSLFVVTNALRIRGLRANHLEGEESCRDTCRSVRSSGQNIVASRPQEHIIEGAFAPGAAAGSREDRMQGFTLTIQGMMCAHCEARVKKTLESLGAQNVRIDLSAGTAQIEADPAFSREAAAQALESDGYTLVDMESIA